MIGCKKLFGICRTGLPVEDGQLQPYPQEWLEEQDGPESCEYEKREESLKWLTS